MASILSLASSVLISAGASKSGSSLYASRCAGTSRNTSGRTSRCLSRMEVQDAAPAITVAASVITSHDLLSYSLLWREKKRFFFCCFVNASDFFVAGESVNSICASQWFVEWDGRSGRFLMSMQGIANTGLVSNVSAHTPVRERVSDLA